MINLHTVGAFRIGHLLSQEQSEGDREKRRHLVFGGKIHGCCSRRRRQEKIMRAYHEDENHFSKHKKNICDIFPQYFSKVPLLHVYIPIALPLLPPPPPPPSTSCGNGHHAAVFTTFFLLLSRVLLSGAPFGNRGNEAADPQQFMCVCRAQICTVLLRPRDVARHEFLFPNCTHTRKLTFLLLKSYSKQLRPPPPQKKKKSKTVGTDLP